LPVACGLKSSKIFATNKKQKYQCQTCKRQFVPNNSKVYINNQTKELIDKLLLEKISLTGIIRVTGVSEKLLQN
jgi:transposase-like protein